jgi:hypothetical protein
VLISFYSSIGYLYSNENEYGRFAEAYQDTMMKINPEKEVIFGKDLKTYYLKELNTGVTVVDMLKDQRYSYDQFLKDLNKYRSGWITWETRKTYHIDPKIVDYVCNNFEHIHGQVCGDKVDDTHVEVFYFNENTPFQETNMSDTSHRNRG